MKNQYYYLFVFVLVAALPGTWAYGQTIEFLFDEGAVKIISVRDVPAMDIEACRDVNDPLLRLFYKYYFPTDLDDYKSIFLDGAYPAGIDDNFGVWRENMNGVRIQVNAIYQGLYKGQTTALLNFDFAKRDLTLKMTFFAKRIEGRWVPYEAKELLEMNGPRFFFPILNDRIVAAMVGNDVKPFERIIADSVRLSCGSGGNEISANCVYAKCEDWGISSEPSDVKRSNALLGVRFVRTNETPAYRMTDLRTAVSDMGIPERDLKVIKYYLDRGEVMIALHRIQGYASEFSFEELNERLRPILQEQALETKSINFQEN